MFELKSRKILEINLKFISIKCLMLSIRMNQSKNRKNERKRERNTCLMNLEFYHSKSPQIRLLYIDTKSHIFQWLTCESGTFVFYYSNNNKKMPLVEIITIKKKQLNFIFFSLSLSLSYSMTLILLLIKHFKHKINGNLLSRIEDYLLLILLKHTLAYSSWENL